MNIPFSIRLENPHVIESHQVFVGVVPTGPAGIKLSSSYENRDSLDYIHDLGNSVVNFSRIVPDGFLVFFPSYGVMAKCLETWKVPVSYRAFDCIAAVAVLIRGVKSRGAQQGVMERISKYKEPIVEPRNKAEFGTVMASCIPIGMEVMNPIQVFSHCQFRPWKSFTPSSKTRN